MKKLKLLSLLTIPFVIWLPSACSLSVDSQTVPPVEIKNIVPIQPAKTAILGYYTNWSTYEANYQVLNIPKEVDEVIYAFTQVGSCNPNSMDNSYKIYAKKCEKQLLSGTGSAAIYRQTGTQDYQLHSTDAYSDFFTYDLYDQKGNVSSSDTSGKGNIAKALARAQTTGSSILLSIGGWTLTAPLTDAFKDANRTNFVNSIIAFLSKAEAEAANPANFSKLQNAQVTGNLTSINKKFDGVDIDWEPNGNYWTVNNGSDTQLTLDNLKDYYKFLSQLRTALNNNGRANSKIKIAITANPTVISDVNKVYGKSYWKDISDLGVTLNLMSYDYNAQAWDTNNACGTSQFNSPLDKPTNITNPCQAVEGLNINASVNALINSGVPAKNIGIGVPAYGRIYAVNSASSNLSAYMPYNSTNINNVNNIGVKSFGNVWTNRQILTNKAYGEAPNSVTQNTNWTVRESVAGVNQTFATALVNNIYPAWISFTSYDNAKNLMTYAKAKGLASVMVWELGQDLQINDNLSDGILVTPFLWGKNSIVKGLADGK